MTDSDNKMYYLKNLCFLCLTYNKNVVFNVNNYLKVENKLKYFLPEQIPQGTETPRYVCDNCVDRLDSIDEFRKKCVDNITIFNDYIQKLTQDSVSYKYLSVMLNDILPCKNSNIVNQINNNIKNTNEKSSLDGNISREIFGTESFEPTKDDESEEISSSSSNVEQIFIKTENVEEFCVKREINELIIKEEPFLLENIPQEDCNKGIQSLDEYNYCDTTSINNSQRNFVEINEFQWEENQNENIHLFSNKYSSNCDTSIKNDSELTKIIPIKEEDETQYRQINSDESNIQKKQVIHSDVDSEKKPYKCKICQKQFKQKFNFSRHKRIHTGERPFVCNICGKRFRDQSNLVNHKRLHSDEKPYECDICKKRFVQKTNLNQHQFIHTREKQYECDVCMKKFTLKINLTQHKLIHSNEKSHKCDVCERAFKTKYYLIDHTRIHTGEKPYQCDVCRKQFKKKANLLRHKRIHTDERPFVCNICGKAFKDRSNLTNHNLLHAVEKPYECDICNKKFVIKRYLNQHKLIHTGENTQM